MSTATTEAGLYGVEITVRPTGALTFRRLPSAILHISTYPFIPPPTLSGWLRRLFLLNAGIYPQTEVKHPDYYVMPHSYHVLGAYPAPDPRTSYKLHTTKRQGVRAFTHNAFSRLSGSRGSKEVYQLHTWEYLLAERFVGIVMHADAAALTRLSSLENMGTKCGKEGYAYLEAVGEVRGFRRVTAAARPTVPATGEELLGQPADLYLAYRHAYAQEPPTLDPAAPQPSAVAGYQAIWLGWPAEAVTLDYWTDGERHIPAKMVEVF